MTDRSQIRWLPDGRRLHLQDGPIDLILAAFGEEAAVEVATRAAVARFSGLLDRLCEELPLLRRDVDPAVAPTGPVARRMHRAVAAFAGGAFITPMAAVAGAVADEVLAAMTQAATLELAYVNNGGDIAIHCAPGRRLTIGMVDRPDTPSLFGRVTVDGADAVRGIATSGWRGRSFSRGIADGVTILARTAADADAAATLVANAVDLPGHPAITRAPAASVQADSDLGPRLVTRAVGTLDAHDRARALAAGLRCAETLLARSLILGAALHLQGDTAVAGDGAGCVTRPVLSAPPLESLAYA